MQWGRLVLVTALIGLIVAACLCSAFLDADVVARNIRATLLDERPAPLDALFSPACQLSVLHRRFGLTVLNGLRQQSCESLSLHEEVHESGRFVRVLYIGWRPEFDECSVGVFMPRVDVGMTRDAKGAVKSVLYHRSTPVTFYIVVRRYNLPVLNDVVKWFRATRFPFTRVVICDFDVGPSKFGPPLVDRARGGSHPAYVVSYMMAHLWALPLERVMITTSSDQVHAVDVLHVYAEFMQLVHDSTHHRAWFGAIRGLYADMWRERTRFGYSIQGLDTPQVVHVRDILLEADIYHGMLISAIYALDPDHGYGAKDLTTTLGALRPDRMRTLGCFSMADAPGLYYFNSTTGRTTTFCESVFRSMRLNVPSVFVDVPEDVRFMSMMMETMRSVPDALLSRMCPFQLAQDGEPWRWTQDETTTTVSQLAKRSNNRVGKMCTACLGAVE
jgi:hypothetical protein